MFTARTGKRSKKARKLKQDEEETVQANEAVNTSPENGAVLEDAGSRDSGELESGAPDSKNVDEPDHGEDGGSDHKGEGEASGGDELASETCKGEGEEEAESEGEEESDESPEDISLAKGKVMAMEQQKNEGEEIKR